MKKNELIKNIKLVLKNLNCLFTTFNNKKLFVEESHINIKIVIISYMKILNKKRNKYLIDIINLINIQKKIIYDYKNSKYDSIKMIYNKIIYINRHILKNYDIIMKI